MKHENWMDMLREIPGGLRGGWAAIARPLARIASRRRTLAYLDQQIARRRQNRYTSELKFSKGEFAVTDTLQLPTSYWYGA
jgi:hypothetical protein